MAKYIKPTFNLTSAAFDATTDPGPLSWVLTLATTPNADANGRIQVDTVIQDTLTTSTTPTELFSGKSGHDIMSDNNSTDIWTPGTDGGFLYMKNTDTSGTDSIYVGIVSNCHDNDGGCVGTDSPTAPTAGSAGHLAATDNATLRTFTLKPGEFAWFPWDYTGRIFVENNAGDPVLEYWLFNRA